MKQYKVFNPMRGYVLISGDITRGNFFSYTEVLDQIKIFNPIITGDLKIGNTSRKNGVINESISSICSYM